MKTTECPRCCGNGHIAAYANIAGGVCFKCGGSGKVAYRVTKANKFSAINAMHCKTLAEAQEYRMQEFTKRFPELAGKLTPQAEYDIKNGCGTLRKIVESL